FTTIQPTEGPDMRTLQFVCIAALLALRPQPAAARATVPHVDRPAAGTIAGRVTDKEGGTPITGVAVTVVGTRLGGVTDDQGRYRIVGVPDGVQTLTAQ